MWNFCFLGNLSAEREGVSVTMVPRKYTALLAYLTLHPTRCFGRDELVALFWPESDGEAGRAALRTALSTLRRNFGADLFKTGVATETIRLRSETTLTDVAQFEALLAHAASVRSLPDREIAQLEAAISLYGGPVLPGMYYDWVVAERERLERLLQQAESRHDILLRNATVVKSSRERDEARCNFPFKGSGPALHRLPLYSGAFVGREAEIEQLTLLLCREDAQRPRFLTLTGPGGIGKTRLAVETANTVAAHFPGAVCFVPLAALNSGGEIGAALADILQIENTRGNPLESVRFRLIDLGPSLLILDNLEQMVPNGAAQAVKTLLASLPDVTMLLTSRRLIGIEGEQEFPVTTLGAESGRKLFLWHALAARPDFDARDGITLQALCERLEGIPLAIELCAPWARVLTEQQMLEHLDRRFDLLVSRRQDSTPRHRSLHATLDWGCPTDPELLDFFAALSIFRDGWTLKAAEAVAGPHVLEHTASLRESSLILAKVPAEGDATSAMRYRMLETVREFAGEKLTPERQAEVQRKSLCYYERFAAEETPHLRDADSARVFSVLDRETANFRASIQFGMTDTPDSLLTALWLIRHLHWSWGMRGHAAPYREWIARAYERRAELPEIECARIQMEFAGQCEIDECESLLNDARASFDRLGDNVGRAQVRETLASIYRERGEYERMEEAFHETITLYTESGDKRSASYTRAHFAGLLSDIGRVADARVLWKQCRNYSVELGEIGSIAVLDRAHGCSLLGEGHGEASIPYLSNAVEIFRHKGESWQVMDSICHLARALTAVGRPTDALPLIAEGLQIARARQDAFRTEMLLALEKDAQQALL